MLNKMLIDWISKNPKIPLMLSTQPLTNIKNKNYLNNWGQTKQLRSNKTIVKKLENLDSDTNKK